MTNRNFWDNIPADCIKAINELKRLKVYNLIATDYEETFSDVWWLVLHEVDLYAEGEFCQEASRCDWADPSAMNIRHCQSADRWLVKWLPLFNKYTDRKYYSESYFDVHAGFDSEPYYYNGQVI
jgi:hypothetical protein